MKKQLLSTSAIALGVAMAAPASAQEWDMDWGGFAQMHVGYVTVDGNPAGTDFDGVNIFNNAEIHFTPSVELDNGLTFGFNVQHEALNGGGGAPANIDEVYVSISGDTLGRIDLGNENSAGYKMMVAAPQVGSMPINSRSISGFIPITGSGGFRRAALSSYTEVAGNNDVARITYYTPSFNGLTLGVSYAPNGNVNAANNGPVDFNAAGSLRDVFDIGLGYSQSFNGVDVNFGARYGTGEVQATAATPSRDPETWGVGASFSVSGFTFGVGYAENETDAAGNVGDQEGLSIGASYDIAGPWTVGLEAYLGETTNAGAAPTSDYEAYKLAASRSLGAGVSWDVYYVYAETNNGAAAGNPELEGNLIATAINLSF